MAKAFIHWSNNDFKTVHDLKAGQQILGIHFADLPTKSLAEGKQIKFTFYWYEADGWEGTDSEIQISSSK
ncbi:MAG: hypothetical protein ABI359_15130 [Ginsengibacter sp.]